MVHRKDGINLSAVGNRRSLAFGGSLLLEFMRPMAHWNDLKRQKESSDGSSER